MVDEIARQAVSLGISGLLFVMWWFERQERTRSAGSVQQALQYTHQLADVNGQLLDVLRANTDALAALREELRTHRLLETEWLNRLSRQLEKLGDA